MFGKVGSGDGGRSYASHASDQAKRITKAPSTGGIGRARPGIAAKKYLRWQVVHRFCTRHPQLFHSGVIRGCSTRRKSTIAASHDMSVIARIVLSAILGLLSPSAASAAPDAMLLRLFLTDGTSVVSFGEYARVDDRVIFSMPAGGAVAEPRLQAVTLPSRVIDWPRTERYAATARYQRYAETRGDEDFIRLSNDVAAVLNEILVSRDRNQALEIATRARNTLADWPREHFGYRQREVTEIVSLLDEAISGLRATAGMTMFDLSLVATVPDIPFEPLLGMPPLREQVDQVFHVAALTERSSERVALLQTALALLNEAAGSMAPADITTLRRSAERQIAQEFAVDAQYASLSRRFISQATRAAGRARIADVERVLNRIPNEDARLGRRRPEVIQALHASVQGQLDAALHLRLLRDRWVIRQALYRDYRRSVGNHLLQLVKAQPALEAVRRLAGPSPNMLVTLRGRLTGGAERLQRVQVPSDLRAAHDLLTTSWRFAENAVNTRYLAIQSGQVATAWEASSAAAGALMFLSRAQEEIRTLLEPPQLR